MRRSLLALLAPLACLVLLPLGGHPALAAEADGYGIRLLEAPSDRKDDPRARLYVVDHAQQGETLTRRFEVRNGTSAPVRLQLYPVAAEITDGRFVIGEDRASNELTRWTSVTPAVVDLQPGERAEARLSVRIPADAEDGERYAGVVAEAPPVSTGGAVRIGSRVGIRMYLDVGSGNEPASDFVVESLQAARLDDGTPVVKAQVRNTGGRALDLGGELKLTEGPAGLSAGPFPAELGTTLGLDQSSPVLVRLDRAITGGPWQGTLTLTSGQLVRAAQASITFPDAAGASSDAVPARAVPLAKDPDVLVPIAAGLIGLLGLALTVRLWRRGMLRRPAAPAPAEG